ncbi:MAG: endolytic transglycosylase MltG [Ruminococcaceae bacterium]|nr:endolytic transglycosylase MltG [Oscillospiraceae bacterium]
MDKNNITPSSDDNASWLDEVLRSSDYGEDVMKELQSIPDTDLELERILQEVRAEQEAEIIQETPVPEADATEDDWVFSETILEEPPVYEYPANPSADFFDEQEETPNFEEIPQEASEEVSEEEIMIDTDRKVRPKKKGGYGLFGLPHLASTAIWIGLIIVIGISLGRLVWICATDVLAFGREDRPTTITITKEEEGNIDAITNKLYDAGLIQYKQLFKIYASISDADQKISAGTFELNTLFDYSALVKGMSASSSYRESIKVTIPEGYTCAQIFALLEEKGVCTAEELKEYEVVGDYWFLEGVNRNAEYPLEGFLFPDTYEFYISDSPKGVFRRFLAQFDKVFTDELKGYIDTLNQRFGSDYTLYDILIIASMIEKESAGSQENYDVSSVIYNRLRKPWEYPTLDIDATIVYAQGGQADFIDTNLDSPYNTYKNPGLPPTPISNPSLLSIQAALSPTETNYHFYALDPSTGLHHFSKDLKEHNAFLESLK